MSRLTVIEKEDLVIDLEYDDRYVAIHIGKLNFNKSTYADMKAGISGLNDFIKTVGYEAMWAVIGASDEGTKKLAKRLGFKYLGEGTEGYAGMYVYEYVGEEND